MRFTIFLILISFTLMSLIKCDDEITQLRQKMINYAGDCYKQLNITKEIGQKMREDRDFAKKTLRCYSACFMKLSNEIDEDNKFNMKVISDIENTFYPEKANETINSISICIEKVKNIEDICDMANAYDDCVPKEINPVNN